MKTPMVSVIMPVYNGEKYLNEAIDSILNQTYTDFEFIILNDGSTDKTEEIILSYDDLRIVYVKNEENLQIVKTLNKGIALAKGKYIARMDADDISLPERFEKQMTFMKNNPDIDVCGTWMKTIGYKKDYLINYPISHNEIKSFMFFNSPMSHPTIFTKKSFYDEYQYSDEFNKVEDYHLWFRAVNTHIFANIPQVLFLYRLHNNMTTIEHNDVQVQKADKIRSFVLKQLNPRYSNEDNRLYIKFIRHEWDEKSVKSIEPLLYRLIEDNKKSNYSDDLALKSYLGEYWWQLFSVNTDKGMKVYTYFMSSDFRKNSNISVIKYIKFYLKCVVRYKFKGGLYGC